MAHYVRVSDEYWKEFQRVQKEFKIDKHDLADDIFALAGDFDAIAEAHVPVEKPAPSTRAAVLEPTIDEELADLI